jgi:uncharacterized protein YciI
MYFFVRTRNPRPAFHLDMTAAERSSMEAHVAYWTEYARKGIAIAFGPVLDPAGVYGVGIYNFADRAELDALLAADPAKLILSYEVMEMPRAVIGADLLG